MGTEFQVKLSPRTIIVGSIFVLLAVVLAIGIYLKREELIGKAEDDDEYTNYRSYYGLTGPLVDGGYSLEEGQVAWLQKKWDCKKWDKNAHRVYNWEDSVYLGLYKNDLGYAGTTLLDGDLNETSELIVTLSRVTGTRQIKGTEVHEGDIFLYIDAVEETQIILKAAERSINYLVNDPSENLKELFGDRPTLPMMKDLSIEVKSKPLTGEELESYRILPLCIKSAA